MEVTRKVTSETNDILVGDQITVNLRNFGEFTATVQKITDKGALFIFDEPVTCKPMNKNSTNEGGYEKSDLKKWIDSVLLGAFPSELKDRIMDLSIPTVGEFFGHDNEVDNKQYEPDEDGQLPLMRERRKRVGCFQNAWVWNWLRNTMKREYSSALFTRTNSSGALAYSDASISLGVRPEFWLKNDHKEGEN